MSPLVSICIPAFNAEATIVSCLQAVLAQDVLDSEILLVDNCSTDRTVELAMETAGGRDGFRVIRNVTNVGRIGNWNRCLEEAKGKYIKFAFTNDALLPGAVNALVRVMEAHPDTVIGGSRQKTVSALPEVMPVVPVDVAIHLRSSSDSLEFLAKNGFASLGSLNGMIYRRSAIDSAGLRFRDDIPYFADFVNALELAAMGTTAYLDAETYLFNEGATGRYHFAGLQNIPKFLEEHQICTRRQMELLKQHGRPEEVALDYLWGRYFWYLGQGWNISPRDGWRTFRGFPKRQLEAAAKTAWFLMRRRTGESSVGSRQ
jgi:glycosyltransferase involved in cell wall biosynthesis